MERGLVRPDTMMYLPIDQMLKGRGAAPQAGASASTTPSRTFQEPEPAPERSVNRERRTR